MPTYAIGDVQGCHRELLQLLDRINFDTARDRLWFTGDLVNRGPASLQTLRLVHDLGESAVVVLGNHDLHLLAARHCIRKPRHNDTLQQVLEAPDCDTLLDWLRRQPLLHHDTALGYTLLHAGLVPQWDLEQARAAAAEVQAALAADDYVELLATMYGDHPDRWQPELRGAERTRCILNCLTRLRYCDADGVMALREDGTPGTQPAGLHPWFTIAKRRSADLRIVFGHWSTLRLGGEDYSGHGVHPLDEGCVWGGALLAMRLEDGRHYRQPALT